MKLKRQELARLLMTLTAMLSNFVFILRALGSVKVLSSEELLFFLSFPIRK
jgi:hypothetical protein